VGRGTGEGRGAKEWLCFEGHITPTPTPIPGTGTGTSRGRPGANRREGEEQWEGVGARVGWGWGGGGHWKHTGVRPSGKWAREGGESNARLVQGGPGREREGQGRGKGRYQQGEGWYRGTAELVRAAKDKGPQA